MPIGIILQLIAALVPLAVKLIDKFVPSKVTRKHDFKGKQKVIKMLQDFHLEHSTLEEIAEKKDEIQ